MNFFERNYFVQTEKIEIGSDKFKDQLRNVSPKEMKNIMYILK